MITAEQKAFKKGKIGASQVAAALGISRFTTKAWLYHELIGNVEPPDLGAKGRIGNAIEPVILQEYEIETGWKVKAYPETVVHPDYPWMICHLDGMAKGGEILIEVKNVGPYMAHYWGEAGDPEGPPLDVVAQCTQQANLMGVDRVDVAAFFGGNEFRRYPLKITKEAKKAVFDGVVSFWRDHVEPRKPPEVSEKDLDLLKELYWKIEKEKILHVEGTKTALMFQEYRQIKNQIKELEVKADSYKAAIQSVMKDSTVLMRGDDIEFTWKKTKDSIQTDWKAVAGEYRSILLGEGVVDEEELTTICDELTKTKPGHRVFLDKAK